MATYQMTPAERKAHAQMLREERQIRRSSGTQSSDLDRYIQQPQATVAEEKKASSADPLTRIGATIADFQGQFLSGAINQVEGIGDMLLDVVGAVGGLINSDFQKGVQDLIEYDWSGQIIDKPMQGVTQHSYLNDTKAGQIVQQVSSGVGQMLPALAVTVLSGGTSAPSALSQGLSLATTAVGAGGNAVEEAYNEGADYYSGLGYGIASGAVEAGTEKLFGGFTSNMFGKGALDDIGKSIGRSVANTGAKKVVANALGEAVEEMAAEAVNPALKSIYKGTDAFSEYADPEFYKRVGEAGLVGGLTSVAYGETFGRVTGTAGKESDIRDSLGAIKDLKNKQSELFADDNLTDGYQGQILKSTEANLRNIEKILKKSNETKRADLISQFDLSNHFDADGSLKPDAAAKITGTQVSENFDGVEQSAGNAADRRYYSPDLWNQTEKVNEDLKQINEELQKRSGGAAQSVEMFDGELSDTARTAYSQFKKGFANLSKKTKTGMNFGLVKPNDAMNAGILQNGKTLYIAEDTLEDGTWARNLVHEVTHFSEGSAEYARLVKHLTDDEALTKRILEELTAFDNAYGFTEDNVYDLAKSLHERKRLEGVPEELYSEINARLSEEVLGNEGFINRLVREDASLSEKIISKIQDLIDAFKRLSDPDARKEYNRLRKAEKLYLQAVENAGWNYVAGKIEKDDEEGLDGGAEVRYNRKKSVRYISHKSVGDEAIRHIKSKLKKIYNGEDGIADGIAIAYGEDVYIVDSGRENGETTFGIRKRLKISDAKFRTEFIRSTNNDAVSKGNVSDELSSRLGDGMGSDSGSSMRRQSRTELQPDSRESQDNKEGVLGKNADKRGVKFSLKQGQIDVLKNRGVDGDALLDAIDLSDEILAVNGEITDDAKVVLYHATSEENARKIIASGKMYGKEDNLFFSTKADGEIQGYGNAIVEAKIPIEKLTLNDVFDDEVHLTMSVKPYQMTNIRFSMKKSPAKQPTSDKVVISKGEQQKRKADYHSDRVFRRMDAENAMHGVDGFAFLPSDIKKELINDIWIGLNSRFDSEKRQKFIEVMRNKIPVLLREKAMTEKNYTALRKLKKQLYWTLKQPEGGAKTSALKKINEKIDQIEGDTARLFDDYDQARIDQISDDIAVRLNALLDSGKPSTRAKMQEEFDTTTAGYWKKEYQNAREVAKLQAQVVAKIGSIKAWDEGKFHKAAELNDDRFKRAVSLIKQTTWRGVLRTTKARDALANLYSWYDPEKNALLKDSSLYQPDIRDALEAVSTGEGALNADELRALLDVVSYFEKFVENYNKVYRNGQYVDAEPIAKRYVKSIQRANDTKVGWIMKFLQNKYSRLFADPLALVRCADQYDPNGFYTQMYQMFQRGEIEMARTEARLLESYRQFLKEHKGFEKHLQKDTVKYRGKDIPVDLALSLYMTTKRQQAWRGIVRSGMTMEIDGKRETFAPLTTDAISELTDAEIESMATHEGKVLYQEFSDLDKEYIKIMEKILNNDCAELKRDMDMKRLGYTNVGDGYYWPISRADTAKNIENENFMDSMNRDRAINSSINKNLVKNASAQLLIRPATSTFSRHIRQVSMYSSLALAVDNFNVLYNLNTGDNAGAPITVQSQSKATEFGRVMNDYLNNLKNDIEGSKRAPIEETAFQEAVRFLRSGYAKYQLGANPKVLMSQLSSLIAAADILDVDCITKGIGIKVDGAVLDEYCPLAQLRNEENSAAMAQGVLETTNKIGDFLMKPIGAVDRFVVSRLFGACQLQVAKNGGAKVGTKENLQKAGELLEKVILETQQNSLATTRSAAMRSNQELLKSTTMFSADSMRITGRLLDAFGEVSVIKRRLQDATLSQEERANLKERLDKANKKTGRAIAVVISASAFMAAISLLFKAFYNKLKDKEPKEVISETVSDLLGNTLGGLPLVRDAYAFFADGYEVNNFAYSSYNDLLGATKGAFDLTIDAIQGKDITSTDVASNVRKVIYAAGQLFGLPVRNVYNFANGVISKVSPSSGYWLDSQFYANSYSGDLQKAIEAGDDRLIATISGLMINETIGAENKNTRAALRELTKAGYKVLPKVLGDTVTYNGEELELNAKQRAQFQKIYSISDMAVESLVKLNTFKNASEEEKARAVRFVYDTYYNLALDNLVGADSEKKNVLFAEAIDIEKLAMIISIAKGITADSDKNGVPVSGSKKKKITNYIASLKMTSVEKYMIMGYLGYTNKYGEAAVKAYINKLNLSESEKKLLLEYSGY